MPVVFADPFGSFMDGFERGQDQRMQVEDFEQQRRLREYDLYDRFVFSPQQQIAKEQRDFNRQLQLMEHRYQLRARERAASRAARAVDKSTAAKRSSFAVMPPATISN